MAIKHPLRVLLHPASSRCGYRVPADASEYEDTVASLSPKHE